MRKLNNSSFWSCHDTAICWLASTLILHGIFDATDIKPWSSRSTLSDFSGDSKRTPVDPINGLKTLKCHGEDTDRQGDSAL